MEIKVIDENTYLSFALQNKDISIYQIPAWGQLKASTGWITHLLGFYDQNNLVGVVLLLEKKTPLKKSLFYAPRGPLFNKLDFPTLQDFTLLIKAYLKEHHGFMLKIDPNIIYAQYDSNKENQNLINGHLVTDFQKLGYKHLGFTQNFENLQPRFLCRFKLKDTYEDTLATFSKSTRKNIEKTIKMGVKTRLIDIEEMDLFVSLLEETGKNKNFIVRPASYYKRMYELMADYMKLYIAYIDTEEYYNYLLKEINSTKRELQNTEQQMLNNHVGQKLKTLKIQQETKLDHLQNLLDKAKELRKTNAKINIGALMSIFIGNEGITFMSGTNASYKNFNPKYAFYNAHILDCLKEKKEYCNFYGISGDMNPNGPYYAIYEIKKGFNPEIIELIGEFDLITSKVTYVIYKGALRFYKLLKKIKH